MSQAATPRVRFVYEERGAPTRYRVWNHLEQARLAGMWAEAVVLAAGGRWPELRGVDLLYLHRLRLSSQTLPLVLAARARRIPVIYDSDDLIWEDQLRQYEALDTHHAPAAVRRLRAEIRRARWLMRLADAFVFSTPYLAQRAGAAFRQPAFVHANALSTELLALSEAARQGRGRPGEAVTIAYFSGTRHAHDEDLASIGAALGATMDALPQTRLLLVGEVALPQALAPARYTARIERCAPVGWRELPALIARADINLAPLIDNPQRRAKSAVKYLEAAAVGVPSLAVNLEPYRYVIIEGATGLLAATPRAWASQLHALVGDEALRARLGEAAWRQVRAEHSVEVRAAAFRALIERILGAARLH